jgi:lipoyl(octanoyl) transferase
MDIGQAMAQGKWICVDLPVMDYREVLSLQGALVEARCCGLGGVVLLLEHAPVFTLGRRGGRENLLVTEGLLKGRGVPVVQAERGGDVTFHGPGQIVGYPILDLKKNGWNVKGFVGSLEEVMIRTAAGWGIHAERNRLNRGVWVGMEKLGSVGIAVRGGISFHGFALNVSTHMEPFEWIRPCGLRGIRMTSMERVLGKPLSMDEIRKRAMASIEEVFQVSLDMWSLEDLKGLMEAAVS